MNYNRTVILLTQIYKKYSGVVKKSLVSIEESGMIDSQFGANRHNLYDA